MRRLWPRSIQGRDTLVATLMAALLLGIVAIVVDAVIQVQIRNDRAAEANRAATRVSSALREGEPRNPIPPDTGGILLQVVNQYGAVIYASREAAGRPPISGHRPPPNDRLQSWAVCPAPG